MHAVPAAPKAWASRSKCTAALVALAVALSLLAGPASAAALPEELEAVLALASEGRAAEARARLDELLERDPAEPYRRLLDSVLLAREGRRTEAIEALEALRRDRPDIPETYNNLAVLYGAERRFDEARTLLLEALGRWPEFAVAHKNLGEVYANLARGAWERARELEAAGAAPAAALSDAVLPPPAAAASCLVAGGIETLAAAEAAGEWLRARGAAAVEVSARPWSAARHWIYAGPLEDRAAAVAMMREARERGVRDVGFAGAGAPANAVSFGVYRDAANARRRADELRRLGWPVETEIEWVPVEGYAVEARGIGATDALRAAWSAEYPAWPIAAGDCG